MGRIGPNGQLQDANMTTPQHPGNDYYVNAVTHTIQRQSNPLYAASLRATGWLGPYDWATAQGVASGLKSVTPNPVTGMPTGPGITANPVQAAQEAKGLFHGLSLPNLFLRIGEVVLGVVLVGVGVAKLTGATNLISSAVKAKIP
jgi:hypothetical protein